MSAAVCPGSGVVVDARAGSGKYGDYGWCPVCDEIKRVEPVEPEGTTPRWRIVDHREAS